MIERLTKLKGREDTEETAYYDYKYEFNFNNK